MGPTPHEPKGNVEAGGIGAPEGKGEGSEVRKCSEGVQ